MPQRRSQQLRRAAQRALRVDPSPAASRGLPTVPQPRPPLAAVRRQTPAEPGADPQASASHAQPLDWARRIELVAVVLGVLLSSMIAAAGIWYSNTQVRDQLRISNRELKVAQEGQITDRYTKAVENLGDGAIDVRLGGVYALQRIMQDSPRDYSTIINVLAAYIRTHAAEPPKRDEGVAVDVDAALTVLALRNPARDNFQILDLQKAHLPGIAIPDDIAGKPAYLRDADLTKADLSNAYLIHADLVSAAMSGINLSETYLYGANLTGAHLMDADMTKADLTGADLPGAILTDADMTKANLTGVDLTDAKLAQTDLTSADLTRTVLSNVDLRRVTGTLLAEQVVSAVIDSTTKLPSQLAEDPAVQARIAEVEANCPTRPIWCTL